jgi:hypothetical protein
MQRRWAPEPNGSRTAIVVDDALEALGRSEEAAELRQRYRLQQPA